MIKSKKLTRFKNLQHAFFNKLGGKSNGIFKSLNCGNGSSDKKENILKNLEIVGNKIKAKQKNQTKKLSFKHQFALENIPKEIAKIEKNIKMFEEKLAEPNLYSENPDLFHKCSAELEKLNALRDQKEEEWLELEILRETIEDNPS